METLFKDHILAVASPNDLKIQLRILLFQHTDRPHILALGSALVVVGFFFLGISNFIYNRSDEFYGSGRLCHIMYVFMLIVRLGWVKSAPT